MKSFTLPVRGILREFQAEMLIKGSLMVTLADWQMCGEANAKIILR